MVDKKKQARYEKSKNSGFFGQFPMVMLDDVCEKKLNPTDVLVYAILHSYAMKSGQIWASNNTLASHLDCSESTIQRALDKLEKAGWIMRCFDEKENPNEKQRYIHLAYHINQIFDNDQKIEQRKRNK